MNHVADNKRQRAPSKRSLETRARIFDSAELMFGARGYEGTSIRDIAEAAGVQKALVSFHGGAKEAFFSEIVARRAEEVADLRLAALDRLEAAGPATLPEIVEAFVRPLLDKARRDGAQWQAYARLIAQVSADPRWHEITQTHFDPTARRFIAAIQRRYPDANPQSVASGFVFTVSAMLSLATSEWRVAALDPDSPALDQDALMRDLIRFCEAGMRGMLER